ncbi:MAG: BON domain-containing protein [Actinomycetota bacterium]|nr:BON domain-containing protein [Actinomycetota bacterium]
MDPETIDEIQAALNDSDRVDARRIQVEPKGEGVLLRGSVSSADEASAAALIAEGYATLVTSELFVDPNLREGAVDAHESEEAVPAENEILVGDTDMLAGPETRIETDMDRALEENVPWDPPTEPHLAPAGAEYGGATSEGGPEPIDTSDPDPAEVSRADYAAADLSQEELELPPERVPSLDPEGVQPPAEPTPDPIGVDGLGATTPDEPEPFPEQVPGTGQGLGGVGEGTAGGGSISGVPATETGARGADTKAADPARSTGGSMTDAGTSRGPEARPDEPLREDFPSPDPEER